MFIRHRTAKEIEEAKAVPIDELIDPIARNDNVKDGDPATDENRVVGGKEQFPGDDGRVHPSGLRASAIGAICSGRGLQVGGWFCPCHGSHYDTAGRIRKGPAPENLHVPKYEYLSDTKIRIG